jgi:hypothetical protein
VGEGLVLEELMPCHSLGERAVFPADTNIGKGRSSVRRKSWDAGHREPWESRSTCPVDAAQRREQHASDTLRSIDPGCTAVSAMKEAYWRLQLGPGDVC